MGQHFKKNTNVGNGNTCKGVLLGEWLQLYVLWLYSQHPHHVPCWRQFVQLYALTTPHSAQHARYPLAHRPCFLAWLQCPRPNETRLSSPNSSWFSISLKRNSEWLKQSMRMLPFLRLVEHAKLACKLIFHQAPSLQQEPGVLPSHGIDTSDNFTKKRDICLGL